MPFEAGSIIARFRIDNTPFSRGLNQAKTTAKRIVKEVEKTLSVSVKVDTTRLRSGLNRAIGTIRNFGARVRATLRQINITNLTRAFRSLAVRATAAFARIRTGISVVLAPLRILRKVLFSLTGFLAAFGAAFGAVALIRRANEVETLSLAFKSLVGSLNEVSDIFLKKLRAATKGTVSDLELMRVTNNAVLLGVAKNSDEFAELANAARRLGRAVGRDAVDALNDLAIGIGRQSRLILDNLGLIVKVEKANAAYAVALGIQVSALTDADRRQAFLNATLDAAREKLKALPADTLTTADAWAQLGAEISNAINTISTALVGGGIPASIAKFLRDNRKKIGDFAEFVSTTVKETVSFVINTIKRLSSGGIGIVSIISALTKAVVEIFGVVVKVTFAILPKLLLAISQFITAAVLNLLVDLATLVAKFFVDIQKTVLDFIAGIVEKQPARLLGFFGIDKDELVKDLKFGEDAVIQAKLLVEKNAKGLKVSIGAITESAVENFVGAIKDGLDEVQEEFVGAGRRIAKAGQGLFKPLVDQLDIALDELRTELQDPFEFEALKISGAPILGDIFDEIVKVREEAKKTFTKEQFEESGQALELFRQKLISIGVAARALQVGVSRVKIIDPIAFFKATDAVRQFVKSLEFKAEVSGLSEAEQQFQKFINTIDDLLKKTTEITQRATLLELKKQLTAAFETTQEQEQIRKLSEELLRFEGQLKTLDLQDLVADLTPIAAAFKTVDESVNGLRERIEAIGDAGLAERLSAVVAGLKDQEIVRNIRDLNAELVQASIRLGELTEGPVERLRQKFADVKDEIIGAFGTDVFDKITQDLDKLQQQLDKIEVKGVLDTFSREFTSTILGSLSEAFIRGESFSKAFADISARFFRNAMDDAIEEISGLLTTALGKIFQTAAGQSAFAGLATGLLGVAGAIFSQLKSKTTGTIDDFQSSITSAEAVRGVVAGPSNIPIAQISSSLRDALRTSELLLERIAVGIERGAGFGGGGGSVGGSVPNSVLQLTGSTV